MYEVRACSVVAYEQRDGLCVTESFFTLLSWHAIIKSFRTVGRITETTGDGIPCQVVCRGTPREEEG